MATSTNTFTACGPTNTMNTSTIVHVTAYYPPHIGGVERMAGGICKRLLGCGYAVRVLTASAAVGTDEETPAVQRLPSFEFAHTPIAPTLIYHLYHIPKHSIIHLHLAQAYWPDCVRLIAWLRRIPYIVHFHLDVGISGPFGVLFLLYKRLTWGPLMRNAARVIACSDAQSEVVQRIYGVHPSKIVVIANAVDDDFFTQGSVHTLHAPLRLLSIGRLVPQKRIALLLRMCTHLKVPATLTIAGDGEERAALQHYAEAQGLPVTFVGSQNDAGMQKLHRSHDVLLSSSEKEGGTPLVVLEAMAAGLPIIAARVSGLEELVKDVGVLVEAPYEEHLARAIEKLSEDANLYTAYCTASRSRAERYRWAEYMQRLEALYTSLV